jgi:hypothetical protein
MSPTASRRLAASPAIGLRASATSVAEPIVVFPATKRVAPVAKNDEVGDNLREDHPAEGVPEGICELRIRGALALPQPSPPDADPLLDLVTRLPEEEIWRDRRSEQGNEDTDELPVEADRRDERAAQGSEQVGTSEECRPDVRDQREGEPLEDPLNDLVGPEDLHQQDPDADGNDGHERGVGRRRLIAAAIAPMSAPALSVFAITIARTVG